MPEPLRTNPRIQEVPNLLPKDAAKLRVSNQLADCAGALIKQAKSLGIHGGEENPATSFLWLFPHHINHKPEQRVIDYMRVWDALAGARPPAALGLARMPRLAAVEVQRPWNLFFLREAPRGAHWGAGRYFPDQEENEYPRGHCAILARHINKALCAKQKVTR